MRTITTITTTTVYSFDELSEEAREKAIDAARDFEADYRLEEFVDCMKSAMDKMGITIKDYSICIDGSGYINLSVVNDDLEGVRAYRYIVNNFFSGVNKKKLYYKEWEKRRKSNLDRKDWMDDCPFTGMCYDYGVKSAWEDFCAELKQGERPTVRDFLDELESHYLDMQTKEYYGFDEDAARELYDANGYEFLEDGTLY